MARKIFFCSLLLCFHLNSFGQIRNRFHLAIGASLPEWLHCGIKYHIANEHKFGIYIGGLEYVSFSADYACHFGKIKYDIRTRPWYARIGITYNGSTNSDHLFYVMSIGREFYLIKNIGLNCDVGMFCEIYSHYKSNGFNIYGPVLLPTLRLQAFYSI